MNTSQLRTERWTILVGIVVVAVGLAAASYRNLEQQNRSQETLTPIYRGLHQDLELCSILRAINEGDVNGAARRLDLMLCEHIVAANSQLDAAGDAGDRAFVQNAFTRFAVIRPRSTELLAGSIQPLRADQVEAQRILDEACGRFSSAATLAGRSADILARSNAVPPIAP